MLSLIAQNLGLWHVTQRYDRDEYVQVVTSNLQATHAGDLDELDPSSQLIDTHQLPYDFASLMHFPAKVLRPLLQFEHITNERLKRKFNKNVHKVFSTN